MRLNWRIFLELLAGVVSAVPIVLAGRVPGHPLLDLGLVVGLFLAWFSTMTLPSAAISMLSLVLGGESIREDCGGLPAGGRIIGYLERSIIFSMFLIAKIEGIPLKDLMNILGLLVAGKAIFRFSRAEERKCADWHIIGTFSSLLTGTAMSWLLLSLLVG